MGSMKYISEQKKLALKLSENQIGIEMVDPNEKSFLYKTLVRLQK